MVEKKLSYNVYYSPVYVNVFKKGFVLGAAKFIYKTIFIIEN